MQLMMVLTILSSLEADQAELDEIIKSVTRIAENTQFGTKKILDGIIGSDVINASTDVSEF